MLDLFQVGNVIKCILEVAGRTYDQLIGKNYWEPFAEAAPYRDDYRIGKTHKQLVKGIESQRRLNANTIVPVKAIVLAIYFKKPI